MKLAMYIFDAAISALLLGSPTTTRPTTNLARGGMQR